MRSDDCGRAKGNATLFAGTTGECAETRDLSHEPSDDPPVVSGPAYVRIDEEHQLAEALDLRFVIRVLHETHDDQGDTRGRRKV
jgi:hypothetical protein